ncbi:hypothetical protein ACFL96_00410 [Thermoproteota archaeon]
MDPKYKNPCAVVFGGYVNAYGAVRELAEKGVENIVVIDHVRGLAGFSNKVKKRIYLPKRNPEELLNVLVTLNNTYSYLILFPTDDLYVEQLAGISKEIERFCFFPFHPDKITRQIDKTFQYKYCEELGIPFPKTMIVTSKEELDKVADCQFPVLVKPSKRDDLKIKIFRNIVIKDNADFKSRELLIQGFIDQGCKFLVSEIIPGNDTDLYLYECYRTKKGEIVNEWMAQKLAQYPDAFGVFASLSNNVPDIVREQSRRLINAMDIAGYLSPEFKYDYRDKKYKLMEINTRCIMANRFGLLLGVDLLYNQYQEAMGMEFSKCARRKAGREHFVYFRHELINLFTRRGYLSVFCHNLFGAEKTHFAVWDKTDFIPFFIDVKNTLFSLGKRSLLTWTGRLKGQFEGVTVKHDQA